MMTIQSVPDLFVRVPVEEIDDFHMTHKRIIFKDDFV